MPFDPQQAIDELNEVLAEANAVFKDIERDKKAMNFGRSGPDRASEVVALCRSAIERYTPEDSPYRRQTAVVTKGASTTFAAATNLAGTLKALIRDFEKGRLNTFEELIHADISGDFFEQAETLLRQGYKDAALVIGGTVLEQHLRLLAGRHRVSIYSGGRFKKADQLNADLTKAGVYGKSEQKAVTAWLGRRNEAAHGHYDAYDNDEVKRVLDAIQAFVIRFPA